MKKLLVLACIALLGSAPAHAVQLNALLGFTSSTLSATPSRSYARGTGLTLGATLEFEIAPLLSFETGLLSVGKKVTDETPPATERTWRALEIPFLVRFTGLPIVDFGAGVYFQKYRDYSAKNVATGIETSGLSWSSAGYTGSDFGLKLSARAKLPIAPMTNFLVDLSVNKGLKELTNEVPNTISIKSGAVNLLAGVAFGF